MDDPDEVVLRAGPSGPGLPILLATGYAELPEGRSLDLPRIAKPYRQGQLAAEIRKLLRGS